MTLSLKGKLISLMVSGKKRVRASPDTMDVDGQGSNDALEGRKLVLQVFSFISLTFTFLASNVIIIRLSKNLLRFLLKPFHPIRSAFFAV